MIAARNERTIRNVGPSVAIGDKKFEVVKKFVYLESLIIPTNDVSLEIRRLQIGAFLHKILIRLVLLYGSETWVWIKREDNQLLVFERKVFQTMCGLKIEKGVYRGRYNHELDREFNSPNALNVTKTSSLCYASHRIRRPKDLSQKALFRAKPNGRKNQGRPKSKWVNSDNLA
jgi:hypothetical protein